MAAKAVLVALALLAASCTAFPFSPFSEEGAVDSEAEESADVAALPMEARDEGPSPYQFQGVHAINGGKPFYVDKDPITGKVDLSGAVPSLTSSAADDYESEEHDGVDRKDIAGTLGRPNDIGGPFKPEKTGLHDFLNLPTRYSNSASKYPLISSSYANTKVQGTGGTSTTHNGVSSGGGIKNHKPYSSSSTQQPHYYPIREKQPTTSEPSTTSTTTTTTTTTTTPRPPPPPPPKQPPTTTATEEPSGWGLDEDYDKVPDNSYSYFSYDDDPTPPPKPPHPSEKPILQSNSHQQPIPTIQTQEPSPSISAPKPTTTTTTTTTPIPTTTTTKSPPTPPKVNVLKPFSQSVVVTPAHIETTSIQTTPTPSTTIPPRTTSVPPQTTSTSSKPPISVDSQSVNKQKHEPSEKPTTTIPPPTKKPTSSSNVVLVPEQTSSNKVVFGKVPAPSQPPLQPQQNPAQQQKPPQQQQNLPQQPSQKPPQQPAQHPPQQPQQPLPQQPSQFIVPPMRPNPYGSGATQPFRPLYENGPQDPNRRPEFVFHNLERPLPPGAGDLITGPGGDGFGGENDYVSFSFQQPSPQLLRPPPPGPPRFPGVEPPKPNPPAPFHQPTRPPPSGFKPGSNNDKDTSMTDRINNSTRAPATSKPDSPLPTPTSRPVVFPDEKKDTVTHATNGAEGTFHHNPNFPPGARPQFIHGSAHSVPPYRGNGQNIDPHRIPVKHDSSAIPPFRGQPIGEGSIVPFRGQPPKDGVIPPFRGQPQGEKLPPPFRGQPQGEKPFRGQTPTEGPIPPFRGPQQGINHSLPPFRGQPSIEDNIPPFRGHPQPQGETPRPTQGDLQHGPPRGQSQGEGPPPPLRGQNEGEVTSFHGKPPAEGHAQPPRTHGENQPPLNLGGKRPEEEDLSSLPTDLVPPADPGLTRPHTVNEYPRPLWETSRPKPPHLYNGPHGLRPKLDTLPPVYAQGPPHYKLGPRIKPNQERPLARKPDGYSEPLPNILPQFRPNAEDRFDPSRTHFVSGPQRMPLMDRPGAGRPHTIYLDGMTPPRPQVHHLRGTRDEDPNIEIGGSFSSDMEQPPPRSVMARRTGPPGESKMRVTTLQMMNYQSHRHVPKTDLSGLKPPYPPPFPASEKPLDERSSVFVVYPVNSNPSRTGSDSEHGVTTRGPNQPSNLNSGDDILGHGDIDDDGPLSLPFALNRQQKPLLNPSRERTDAPILKSHRDHPNSLTKTPTKNQFPYTIVQPDSETKSPSSTEVDDKKLNTDQETASTGDNNSEINIIPYLQDYLPFATKKPKEEPKIPYITQWASEKMDKVEQEARIVVGSGTSAPPTNIKAASSISRTDITGPRSPPSRHETVIGDNLQGSQFTVGAVMHTLSAHRSSQNEDEHKGSELHLSQQAPINTHLIPDTIGETPSNRDTQGYHAYERPLSNHRLPQPSVTQDSEGFQAPFQASVSVGNSALTHGWSVVSGDTTSRPGLVEKADIDELTNTTDTKNTSATPSAPVGTETSSKFDIENFKPQLFSGFKPIFPGTEESESGQPKETSRSQRQVDNAQTKLTQS